jgi:putative peptide zinc metalloprotease protein
MCVDLHRLRQPESCFKFDRHFPNRGIASRPEAALRSGAQISRQFYRGERWYVVRDPAGNQYHRLSDPAYRFVGVARRPRPSRRRGIWSADNSPTTRRRSRKSSRFSRSFTRPICWKPTFRRMRRFCSAATRRQVKRKMQGRLMNVLFPRIPIWDPDAFLKRWMPLARVAFSWFGAIVWLAWCRVRHRRRWRRVGTTAPTA